MYFLSREIAKKMLCPTRIRVSCLKKVIVLLFAAVMSLSVMATTEFETINYDQPQMSVVMNGDVDSAQISQALVANLVANAGLEEQQMQKLSQLVNSNPDRITAAVLAILLGDLGIQHFYVGQTTRGIIDIIFFWTGIPAIVGLVEGIIWLLEDDAEFEAKFAR